MTITARFNHLNYDIDRVQLPAAFQSHTRISWLWNSHDPLKRHFQAWRPMNIYINTFSWHPARYCQFCVSSQFRSCSPRSTPLFLVFAFSVLLTVSRDSQRVQTFGHFLPKTPECMISWAMISFSLHSQEGINFLRVTPLMTWNNKHYHRNKSSTSSKKTFKTAYCGKKQLIGCWYMFNWACVHLCNK